MKPSEKELLIRIDEKLKELTVEVKEHNIKLDKLTEYNTKLQECMINHVNLHKRDISIIGLILGSLTILLSVIFHFVG